MKVVVVDDNQACLDEMRMLLNLHPEIYILACISNPKQVLAQIQMQKPDLIFMDIEMPRTNGLELAEQISSVYPGIKLIFVTAYNKYAIQAIKAGAFDYLVKPVDPDELRETLNRISSNLDLQITLPERIRSKYNLTTREVDVVDLIRQGWTSDQIASRLNLSIFTISTHRQNILRKTDCKNFSELLGRF